MEKNVKIEELVLEALAESGFVTEDQGNDVYVFETGVAKIAYDITDDEHFLRLVMPYVLSLDEISEEVMNTAINKTNDNVKYAKAFLVDGDCFICYERHLNDWDIEHLQDILEQMIECLNYAKLYIHGLFDDEEVTDGNDDEIADAEEIINTENDND